MVSKVIWKKGDLRVLKVSGKKTGFDFERYTHYVIKQGNTQLGADISKTRAVQIGKMFSNISNPEYRKKHRLNG